MSFEYWGYTFEGAWEDPINLDPRPGVYAIWCNAEGTWTVLHVGEAEDVKNAVMNHSQRSDWQKRCRGKLYYATTYTPGMLQAGREEIIQRIKALTPTEVTSG
jgi:hypothetical protein